MSSIGEPPWLCHLLSSVRSALAPVSWMYDPYNADDVDYIASCVESATFDTLGLQRGLYTGFQKGSVEIVKKSCIYGTVLVLYEKATPWKFPWTAVGHVLRLFHRPGKTFRVVFFGSTVKRSFPSPGVAVSAENVNGGYTMPCDPGSIVVFRREEAVRVLIHECYHASCSDPHETSVPHLEANTEAWAEITYVALAARGRADEFARHFRQQMIHAYKQSRILAEQYNVIDPKDYAWRYTIGKFAVWKRLGFHMPLTNSIPYRGNSLRLSLELTNVKDEERRRA
jgi:hypothetical protein